MLADANMLKVFWSEAVRAATYIMNRSPTTCYEITPAEVWNDKKPNVTNLKIFGSVAYSHIPKQFRKKFDE